MTPTRHRRPSQNAHDEVWESLGTQDADWAVSSAPSAKHGGWSRELDAFYAEGQARVEEALRRLPDGAPRAKALDWGSGTGRLSFALAEHYDSVTCVDISHSMLDVLARRAEGRDIDNVVPMHLSDYRPRGDHDLALSLITLQHFPSRDDVGDALVRMLESLRPGGHLVVELPSRPRTLRYRVQPRLQAYRLLRRLGLSPAWLHRHGMSGISMLCAPPSWVIGIIGRNGGKILAHHERVGTSHIQVHYVAERL